MSEELEVGMRCIKYMLFVANFMFVMIGFLLISIGSTIKAIYGDFDIFMETHYFSPSILSIVIGVIIFFVALFGCVGALKQSTLLINFFAFFLTLLLIMEIAAAIAAYSMRDSIESDMRERMEDSISRYDFDDKYNYYTRMWDFTQNRLHCCGVDNSSDWTNRHFPTVPKSCCRYRSNCREYYGDGCLSTLTYIVSESALLLGCGALAVAFIQLLGIVFALLMAKTIRKAKTQELLERDVDRQRAYEQLSKNSQETLQTPVLYTPTSSEA